MFFLVYYVAPFFLLSAVAGIVFFVFPTLRRYTLYAFVAPLAFGASAILGMLAIVLFGDFVLGVSLPGGNWAALMIYIALGLCGAAIAMYALSFLQTKLRRMLESPADSRRSGRIRPF
jgi:peptidoglycan/LPS O-acetylase OafA/YrhL